MSRCVIVGGADINNCGVITGYLREDDYFIFCDSGLRHMTSLRAEPNLIVGDFDSYAEPRPDAETIVLPCEKDDTDTVFAVREAVRRGFDEFLLIGVVGGRADHTLGNIAALLWLDSLGKRAKIADDYSEMEIVSRDPAYIEDSFAYFSLLAVGGNAEGVTVENAKYPLENAVITCEYPYGISNEVLSGMTARVCVSKGRLLLIKVRQNQSS